jgi:phage tail-like protein
MDEPVIRYALVRDRLEWEGASSGLDQEPGGALVLARTPASPGGLEMVEESAQDAVASGIAVDGYGRIYLSNTGANQIAVVDEVCSTRVVTPGEGRAGSAPGSFSGPAALLVHDDALFVADSGNGRIQELALPSLHVRMIRGEGLLSPIGIARDSDGRFYILDAGLNSILRFDDRWMHDTAYASSDAGAQSGARFIATGGDDLLFVSWAEAGQSGLSAFRKDGTRLSVLAAPAPFSPGALAADSSRLYVTNADGTVLVFDARTLLFIGVVPGYRGPASAMALDQAGNLYLKPRAGNAQPSTVKGRVYTAVGDDGTRFVVAAGSDHISVLDANGVPRPDLQPPAPFAAGPLAAGAQRLYAANARDRSIVAFDSNTLSFSGSVPGYYGLVAALSVDGGGSLHLQSEAGDAFYRLTLDSAHVAQGTLQAGPLDAGQATSWLRLRVDADAPEGTEVIVDTAVSTDTTPPDPTTYQRAVSLDLLLSDPRGASGAPLRYLWVRVTLASTDPRLTPRLLQIEAQTPGRSYIEDLPAVYRRGDANSGFLQRWLELARAQVEDVEHRLDDLADHFDPHMAPEDELRALGTWIAFEWPVTASGESLRRGLADAWNAYGRRGTLTGLADLIALYSGVRPEIIEAYRARHLWRLGDGALGFDTGLAPALPDGMVVPGPTLANPDCAGLTRELFAGIDLEGPPLPQSDPAIDPVIDFSFSSLNCSIRWTGQIQPLYSEIYTFYTRGADGTRLWIDEQLIIDAWTLNPGESRGFIRLESGRWYRIALEYYHSQRSPASASIQLGWSSASQQRQVVPSRQLYAVFDETVTLEIRSPLAAPPDLAIVGETVVGAHGPLTPDQFGEPLFTDTAHRFTLRFPASYCPDATSREMIRQLVEREKPAHTDAHICYTRPQFLVGVQAEIGRDAVLGEPAGALVLGETTLGLTSIVKEDDRDPTPFRIGQRDRLAVDTKLE